MKGLSWKIFSINLPIIIRNKIKGKVNIKQKKEKNNKIKI